jgi:cystathionine beta-synthase
MKMNSLSQLPVMNGGEIVGILDESDLLKTLQDKPTGLDTLVQHVISTQLRFVSKDTRLENLILLLDAGFVPILDDIGNRKRNEVFPCWVVGAYFFARRETKMVECRS